MALIKEDYGLIYNDDGSLCVTVRDDDVPFQGVKSFAVEEATENLISQGVSGYAGIVLSYIGEESGWKKYGISGTWQRGSYPYCMTISAVPFTGGEYYSASGIFKTNCEEKFDNYFASINHVNGARISDGLTIRRKLKDNSIYLARQGFGYVDNTTQVGYIGLRPKADGETFDPSKHFLWVKNIQVENKPYNTSFVDGSRQTGRMAISLPKPIKNYNDWVINSWVKIPSSTDSQGIYILTLSSISSYPNISLFITSYGLHMRKRIGSESIEKRLDYINHDEFAMITWIYDGVNFKIYINGILEIDNNLGGIDWSVFGDNYNKIYIGSDLTSYYMYSLLFSNLFIGEYKDKNGNTQWTDEYIQEVYEAKKPFNTNM